MIGVPNISGYIAAILISAALVGAGVWHYKDLEIQSQKLQSEQSINKLLQKQASINNDVSQKQIRVQHDIVTKYSTIEKQIPVYIHTNDPTDDPYLSSKFIVLHNAAATDSELPNPSSGVDDPSAKIKASDLLTTVVDNYQICFASSEELAGLQDWVRQVGEQKERSH